MYTRANVRKGEFVAVQGTWLGIHENECFCLLGPNGAGKTTTINCLTGVRFHAIQNPSLCLHVLQDIIVSESDVGYTFPPHPILDLGLVLK